MHFLATQKYQCSIYDSDNHDYVFNPNSVNLNIKRYLFLQSSLYFLGFIAHIYIDFDNSPSLLSDHSVFYRMQEILSSPKEDIISRQFAYCHTMLTHYPFHDNQNKKKNSTLEQLLPLPLYLKWVAVFDNTDRTLGSYGDSLLMNQYLFKVKQTNDSLQTTLNQNWAHIKENSIVIIMSDHGFRTLPGQSIDFQSEAFSNFCAVYFPDQDYATLTDTITPINVLRMSVNKAVGTSLPYLPDKTNLK
jgi:hypothetical protein